LYRTGVGEEFSLPGDCRLDQAAEERSHQAQHEQSQSQHHVAATRVSPARPGSPPAAREHHDPSDDRQHHDPGNQADQPDIEPHVAVEDVAELVGHHPLQLVAGEVIKAALGDGDHGVARSIAGREGVDARLIQKIDGRHRHSRGDGHLLDDVEQPLLPRVGGRTGDLDRVHHQGNRLAAG